jgi:hypothetical protein
VALNIIVYREARGWAVKRGDEGRLIAWFPRKEDAIACGRTLSDAEDLLLVVVTYSRDDESQADHGRP